MKVATLVDLPFEYVKEYDMRVEEILNDLGGRLIYRLQSKDPIRLVPAENGKYPPNHTPLGKPELSGKPGQGVKHAEGQRKGNVDRRVGGVHRARRGTHGGSRRIVPDIPSASQFVLERDGKEPAGRGLGHALAVPDCGGHPLAVRVRIAAERQASPGLNPESLGFLFDAEPRETFLTKG